VGQSWQGLAAQRDLSGLSKETGPDYLRVNIWVFLVAPNSHIWLGCMPLRLLSYVRLNFQHTTEQSSRQLCLTVRTHSHTV
jgi:hypothetical protein